MGQRGRPSLGVGHVDRLDGEAELKERLSTILRTLTGGLSVEQACQQLGVGAAQFHRLRERALQGALSALEPGLPGRPSTAPPEESVRVQTLEAEVRELKIDLRAAQLREEIAVVMPHLLTPTAPEKKRRRRQRRG